LLHPAHHMNLYGFNEMREACFTSATRNRLAASVVTWE
jgi:hypothetical protein